MNACSKHTPANVQLYARLTQVYVVMQPMGCNKLTQGKEALMKVMLIQLADKASILSVTLAHCIAGGNNAVCVLIWVDMRPQIKLHSQTKLHLQTTAALAVTHM